MTGADAASVKTLIAVALLAGCASSARQLEQHTPQRVSAREAEDLLFRAAILALRRVGEDVAVVEAETGTVASAWRSSIGDGGVYQLRTLVVVEPGAITAEMQCLFSKPGGHPNRCDGAQPGTNDHMLDMAKIIATQARLLALQEEKRQGSHD